MGHTKLIPADFQPHHDGKRFHVRTYNGGLYQVYACGLEHVCECTRVEMADMVADSLEALAGIADPSAVGELVEACYDLMYPAKEVDAKCRILGILNRMKGGE